MDPHTAEAPTGRVPACLLFRLGLRDKAEGKELVSVWFLLFPST